MNQIISLALIVLGLVLLFAPEYILKKDDTNSFTSTILDYNKFISVGLIACGYYLYSTSKVKNELPSTVDSEAVSPSPNPLPSYEEATSE